MHRKMMTEKLRVPVASGEVWTNSPFTRFRRKPPWLGLDAGGDPPKGGDERLGSE